jgi:acyl-CoA synthetase (AMP-forming)/AMP-acid ligase II
VGSVPAGALRHRRNTPGVGFVSLRLGTAATAEEPIEHARQHLSRVKYPHKVWIVPSVRLTSVGKLDRKNPGSGPNARPGG